MTDQNEKTLMPTSEKLDQLHVERMEYVYQGVVSPETPCSLSFKAALVTLPDGVRTFEVFATKKGTPMAVFQTGPERDGKIPKQATPFPKSKKGNAWLLRFGSSKEPKDRNRLVFTSYPGVSIPGVLGKIAYNPDDKTFTAFLEGDHESFFDFTELDPKRTMDLGAKYEVERRSLSSARLPSQRAGFKKRTL